MFDDQQTNQTPTDSTENVNDDGYQQSPVTGIGGNPSASLGDPVDEPVAEPALVTPTVVPPQDDSQDDTEDTSAASTSNDLTDIKRQALEQLSPLVHKLDQTPEEKYKTLIMMIQASDNQDLLGEAYEAAQQISDEKAKAEALLNIVNEINYFSQKS